MATHLHIALCLIAASTGPGSVLYVDDDAPPGGNGQSWATALRFLQDALWVAGAKSAVSEIRLGQGTYRPDQSFESPEGSKVRTESLYVIDGVAITGGFAGYGAPDPDARDVAAFETVLSGDLQSDDGPDFANYGDNSYHVLWADDASTILDGVTITGGNASVGETYGAGLYVESGTIDLVNCTVRDCSAGFQAGAVFWETGLIRATDCRFLDNRAELHPFMGDGGGALMTYGGDAVLTRCLFAGNQAHLGGALVMYGVPGYPRPRLTAVDCRFTGNTAFAMGAVGIQSSDALVVNCTFTGNTATGTALGWGSALGGISGSKTTIVNSVFTGNVASQGGTVWTVNELTIVNSTIAGNHADGLGGGALAKYAFSNLTIRNSILWGNTDSTGQGEAAQVTSALGAAISASHSCIEGLTGSLGGAGNIGSDPLLVDLASGDVHLTAGSPSIDAGHNWAVPDDGADVDIDADIAELTPLDLDGLPRFAAVAGSGDPGCGVPAIVDMGAFESPGAPASVRLADLDGNGAVNITDFIKLLAQWGPCAESCCLADLDLDGAVGILDFLRLLIEWS